MEDTIGFNALGYYIPEGLLSAEEMSVMSGIPESVFTEKIGIRQKHIANQDESPAFMGLKATESALKKSGLAAEEIDVIIYAAAGLYDYNIWSPAAKIQGIIGAKNATCFEVKNGCGAGNLALHLCKSWLLTNKKNHGLVICAEGLSKLVNYQDKNSIAWFTLGDGAAAAILSKNSVQNKILAFASYTDGTLVDYVKILGGGTIHFPGDDNYAKNNSFFNVSDKDALAYVLDKLYLKNYVHMVTQAVNDSGYAVDEIKYLFHNQVKQTTSDAILHALKLSKEQTITTLSHYGHMGAVDVVYCLAKALEENKIKKGDLVVLASSATGFTWASQVIKF